MTSTVYTAPFTTVSLGFGASRTFTLNVKQPSPIPPNGTYNLIIDIISQTNAGDVDSIKAIILKSNARPDGMIDNNGFNVFGSVGSGAGGQSSRSVTAGVATGYNLAIQNSETFTDTFTLTWNTPSGWTVVVNDGTTDQASGFTTASVPANGVLIYTVVVTPTATGTQNIIIDIASTTNTYRVDSVKAIAAMPSAPAAPIACTGAAAPSAVCLAPSAISSSQIKVYWVDNSNNETGFHIERANGGCGGTFNVIYTLLQNSSGTTATNKLMGYTDSGLSPSTTYCYRFQAFNSIGNSAYSATVSLATLAAAETQVPAAVTDLAVAPSYQTQNSIMLGWTAPSDNKLVSGVGQAGSYHLRYSTSPIVDGAPGPGQVDFGTLTDVSGLAAPKLAGSLEQATVPGLTPNTIYYFALKSTNTIGTSAMSNLAGGDNTTNGTASGRTALRFNFNIVSIPMQPPAALSCMSSTFNPGPSNDLPGTDPRCIFGDDIGGVPQLWNWIASTLGIVEGVDGCYNQYPGPSTAPCVNISTIIPGKGYFILGGNNRPVIDVPVGSTAVATSSICGQANSYSIPLQLGWNMIGDPFTKNLTFSTVWVRQNGSSCATFATAVTNGWVGNSVYDYNGSGYNSTLYSSAVLELWKGYWLFVFNNNVINGNTYELIVPQPP
ncbi:MAG: fibronectin type III domain-containing protein [Nitrospirae bacterium]|nr:fibronectin type III domain-containing protein [Nitrospirota bacterium]